MLFICYGRYPVLFLAAIPCVYIHTRFVCFIGYFLLNLIQFITMVASLEDDVTDSLPDKNFAKEFYAKYEPKDVLGRYVC